MRSSNCIKYYVTVISFTRKQFVYRQIQLFIVDGQVRTIVYIWVNENKETKWPIGVIHSKESKMLQGRN